MVSVVIPVYNEEKLLPGCLESLRNQDYQGECEIIIADNGSTDKSATIARSFGAKIVPCPEKKSVFYARQVGADAASGDIIAQADADTLYPKDWVRRIAGHFASHPEVVAVAGRYFYRDPPCWAKFEYRLRHVLNTLSVKIFHRPLIISGVSFAFRRKAFIEGNGYRGLPYSADQYGISGRLSKRGKILYDKDLCVLTSARSVQRAFPIIVLQEVRNIGHWGKYFSKHWISTFHHFTQATRRRRIATRVILPVLVIAISVMGYGYAVPTSSVFGKVYFEGPKDEKVVALTFDDGPNEPYTSAVLDILEAYNVKATFFLIGENVQLYPETAQRILAEGHVIGNHSYSHNANHALTQYGSKDLEQAQTAIFSVTGVIPHLYRPPHGKKSPWELHSVKKCGLVEVTWSVSVNEEHRDLIFGKPSPEKLAEEIIKKVRPGAIILLHDGYGTYHDCPESNKTLTVELLPLVIQGLKAKGYEFVTVPELLKVPAYQAND